jgi:uncharacterized protein with NRDE domain
LPESEISKHFNFRWSGVRQKVELPQNNQKNRQGAKKIEPEMLSQKFLKSPEYHQYDDWRALMEQTYDNFNLMVTPENVSQIHLNFDSRYHKRRAAKGIFPLPNKKRVVLQHKKQLESE